MRTKKKTNLFLNVFVCVHEPCDNEYYAFGELTYIYAYDAEGRVMYINIS